MGCYRNLPDMRLLLNPMLETLDPHQITAKQQPSTPADGDTQVLSTASLLLSGSISAVGARSSRRSGRSVLMHQLQSVDLYSCGTERSPCLSLRVGLRFSFSSARFVFGSAPAINTTVSDTSLAHIT